MVTEVQVNVIGIHFDRKEDNDWPRGNGEQLGQRTMRQSNLTRRRLESGVDGLGLQQASLLD